MNKTLNFIGKRKIWYTISIVLIVASLISFFTQGLNKGLDFTGGNLFQLEFTQAPDAAELRAMVESYLSQTSTIQNESETNFLIRTTYMTEEESSQMLNDLESTFGEMEILRNEVIGPAMGNELISKAMWALVIAVILMLVYITIRFKFFFAVSAVIPLIHDVLITAGLFSIFQVEVSSSFVAAILTILGYSINATVVIFDRIRENMRKGNGKEDFALTVNDSINQTLARSINTSVAVLLLLAALFFFGGSTTRDFALALLIGTIAGGYSSVCIAGSILTDLVTHSKKKLAFTKRG